MSITKEEIDDLDDLDDLLDDFDDDAKPTIAVSTNAAHESAAAGGASVEAASSTIAADGATLRDAGSSQTAAAAGASTGTDKAASAGLPPLANDDFAKQLQAGMEDLMAELNTSPNARRDFEQLMQQMQTATLDPSVPGASSSGAGVAGAAGSSAKSNKSSYPNSDARKAAASAKPKNFQEQLNANIARMRETEQQAQRERDDNAGLTEAETDLFMREMMRQFESASGGGGGGAGGEGGEGGDFSKVLEGMMAQLMSKEILYEPLLELDQKYPVWLRENAGNKDIAKYTKQAGIVREIVAKFEDEGYSDDDEIRKAEVMDLMGQMQDLGSPPQEIMGEDLGMLDGQMPKLGDGECSVM